MIRLEEPLATIDEEIRKAEFDPYHSVAVLVALCRNSPRFLHDAFPVMVAALVEKRLALIAPRPEAKRGARASK